MMKSEKGVNSFARHCIINTIQCLPQVLLFLVKMCKNNFLFLVSLLTKTIEKFSHIAIFFKQYLDQQAFALLYLFSCLFGEQPYKIGLFGISYLEPRNTGGPQS